MKNGKRFLAAVLVATLFMTQPGADVLAGAVGSGLAEAVETLPSETAAGTAGAPSETQAIPQDDPGQDDPGQEGQAAYTLNITGGYTQYVTGFDQVPTAPVDVVVPDGVDAVASSAFQGNEMVRSISNTSIASFPVRTSLS